MNIPRVLRRSINLAPPRASEVHHSRRRTCRRPFGLAVRTKARASVYSQLVHGRRELMPGAERSLRPKGIGLPSGVQTSGTAKLNTDRGRDVI